MTRHDVLTAEQFIDLPHEEGKIRELDNGQLIERALPELRHAIAVPLLVRVLSEQVDRNRVPFWVASGCGFKLGPETFRIPDAFVVRKSSAASMAMFGGWYEGSPELVAEVVSESDTERDLDRRRHQYLRAGASAVWVFYPETRHVMICNQDGTRLDLREGQQLTLPGLLPELRIEVSRIFARL